MPYTKENPGKGRPKGSKNKKTILRAGVWMALNGVCPAEEMAELARITKNEMLRFEIYRYLQSLIEAPQDKPIPYRPDTTEESKEKVAAMDAHLAELSKPLEPIQATTNS